MLSCTQIAHIQDCLYSSDHDFFFWSGMLGEPFLEQEVLYYFDGEVLTVIGYLIDVEIGSVQAAEILHGVVLKWLENSSVKIFNYFGPLALDFESLLAQKFFLLHSQEPDPHNVDTYIDLTDFNLLKTRNAKESMRKAKKQKFDIWIGRRLFLGFDHLHLIHELASRDSVGFSDVCYLTNIVSILKSDVTTFFEARINESLIGFLVTHEFFVRKPFLILACFANSCRGVADALYATAIQYFSLQGARRLGLGYSIDEGILQYKMKWGGVKCIQPFYQFIWVKKGITCSLEDPMPWTMRLCMTKASTRPAKY